MKTVQRNTILSYLKNNTSHPTARDIYAALSKKEVSSLATVYNTLSLMKKNGLIRELAIRNIDYKRYDPNTAPHAHLICKDCGTIVDVKLNFIVEIPDEEKQGFDVYDNDIDFYGLCPNCKGSDKTTSEERGKKMWPVKQ